MKRKLCPCAPSESIDSNLSLIKNHRNLSAPEVVTKWKFPVDYNDHFETPLSAYEDIQLFLEHIALILSKRTEDLIIFDPYYCQGQTISHLKSLSFEHVINRNRDFYKDISNKNVPGLPFKLFSIIYLIFI